MPRGLTALVVVHFLCSLSEFSFPLMRRTMTRRRRRLLIFFDFCWRRESPVVMDTFGKLWTNAAGVSCPSFVISCDVRPNRERCPHLTSHHLAGQRRVRRFDHVKLSDPVERARAAPPQSSLVEWTTRARSLATSPVVGRQSSSRPIS